MQINNQLRLWSLACRWYHLRSFWRSLAFIRWILGWRRRNGWSLSRVIRVYGRGLLFFVGSSSCILGSSLLRLPRRSCPCLFRYRLSCFRFPRGFLRSQPFRCHRSGCSYATPLRGTEGVRLWCMICSPAFLRRSYRYFIAPSRNYSSHFRWHRICCCSPAPASSVSAENWPILAFFCSARDGHPSSAWETSTPRFFRQWIRC